VERWKCLTDLEPYVAAERNIVIVSSENAILVEVWANFDLF
jgi:hypothetical protein